MVSCIWDIYRTVSGALVTDSELIASPGHRNTSIHPRRADRGRWNLWIHQDGINSFCCCWCNCWCFGESLFLPILLCLEIPDIANIYKYLLGGYRIQQRQSYGVELALLASIVLAGSSIPRAIRSQKPLPTGLSLLALYGLYTYGSAFARK